jgi:nucleoid-associated protein YgaU
MGLFDKILGKEEKKADFSDVKSGSSSSAPAPSPTGGMGTAPAAGTGASSARTYTVVSGDSLSKIAKREYGDAQKWHAIYEANRDKIKNPDLIHPGQVLTIPPLS